VLLAGAGVAVVGAVGLACTPTAERLSGPAGQAPSGSVEPAPSMSRMGAAPPTTERVPSAGRMLPAPPRRPAPATFTYAVRSVGAVRTDRRTFAAAALAVYADPRGWASAGMAFREVPDGGDFTLWIAAADRVAGFGPPCDRSWSCRSGRNVVINEDRWRSGSPTRVLAGDLPAYRAMAINHETGHWLGLSHRRCPAQGALAPVMQQQSISLQGCRANAWPTAPELAAVANLHPRPTG